MPYKILMLGGKRAGKSTILATVLHSLINNQLDGCTFKDNTAYPQYVTDKDGSRVAISTLNKKRIEVDEYLRTRDQYGVNSKFLVDMSSSIGRSEYEIQSSIGKIGFTFVDVPGEWMNAETSEFATLKTEISNTDVFIIAIDTPYLMQMRDGDYDNNVNDIYNRIAEIRNAFSADTINIQDTELDKKLMLFCPIKCEKWINEGRVNDVVDRIKSAYSGIINDWATKIGMWILPIQTAGGIESYKLLPAMKVFNTEKQNIGERCSVENGMVIYPMGNTIREYNVYRVEVDAAQKIDFVNIPHSWYKTNSKGFKPIDCEQVMYYLLRFLVEKETLLMENKKAEWLELSWWQKMWRRKPPFGQYLPQYQQIINQLVGKGMIKENRDGFIRIITENK